MHSLLPQQLSTIESMDDRQARAEQDPNNRAQEISNNNNNDVKKASSSSNSHSPEETASQLTEGTLRAMRDLALDEALELHASLKYWTDRWERPVFSWFVAGPLVWFNWIINTSHNTAAAAAKNPGGGYDHAVMVGQRVSQIQAVLARRLAAIGELQHHLLRAGWQRGVAHWGFLGEGGNWAAVDGTDGRMIDDDGDDCSHHNSFDEDDSDHDEYEDDEEDNNMILYEEQQDDQHYDSEHFFAADPQPDHNTTMMNNNNVNNKFNDNNVNNTIIKPLDLHQSVHHQQQQYRNHRYRLLRREHSEASVGSIGLHIDVPPLPPPGLSNTPRRAVASARMSQHNERRKQGSSLYYTNLHVRKRNGGHIQKNDPAMAEWSIDALALIRSQLIRAANGKIALPYSENWPFNQQHVVTTGNASVVEDQISLAALDRGNQNGMPAWAGMKYITSSSSSKTRSRMESRGSCCFSVSENVDNNHHDRTNSDGSIHGTAGASYTETFPKIGADCFESHPLGEEETPKVEAHSKPKRRSPSQMSMSSTVKERAVVGISNLPLMMNEVSSILDVMEDIMDIQRARRLEKLKPPSWWRQNWFLVAMGPPTLTYLLYNNLIGKGQTWNLVRYATETMLAFSREHVVEPCYALYDEFTKGPESISDHAARDTVTETLKKMIRSWLDETYPDMGEAEKVRLSDAMDITLVEESKEDSMKSVYNMNSVIRMSFIEAQFIKKEMMNALVALDEMQASTNFNMNLAAITPFVLLMWTIKKVSRFIFYTAFKWGKSRIETYRSFLNALTEIERLLIMRSNPPAPPPILRYDSNQTSHHHHHREGGTYDSSSHAAIPAFGNCVLESDDLGMLMLHIHEIRMILWEERRRFSPNALRSVSEDLAELSGERGAVSVRQQLLIVERMNRAYSFLKQGAID